LDQNQTAVHEAGHVVVGYVLGLACNGVALTHHEVEETGAYGYAVSPNPEFGYHNNDTRLERQLTLRAQSVASCAGLAAEHVFFGVPLETSNESAQDDFQNVIECESRGLRIRGKRGGYLGDEVTWRYISRLLVEAKKLVKRHRETIQRLADTLLERTRLDGKEVERLLNEWIPGRRA
jgi:ATP-dependent Zn protease